jgi:hypothetical protein
MKGGWRAASIGLLSTAALFCQSTGDPVPAKWLHAGRLVVPDFNFSINSPRPNSRWTYRQVPNIQGQKATAFVVDPSPEGTYLIIIVNTRTDTSATKNFMNDLKTTLPKDWQAQDAHIEASAFPKKDSVKFAMTLRRPDQPPINFFGYIVPDRVTYELVDYTTEKTEPQQFNAFVRSFSVLSQTTELLSLSNITWALISLTVFATGILVGREFWKAHHEPRVAVPSNLPPPGPRMSFSRWKPKTQIGIGLGMCLCYICVAILDQIQGNSTQALGQLVYVLLGAYIAHRGRRRLQQEQAAEHSDSGPNIGPLDL